MLLFTKIIVGLALITFPLIKSWKKGAISFMFNKGIIFGFNVGSTFYETTHKETGETDIYEMISFQFHLAILTATMSYVKKRPDLEVEKYED